MSAPVLYIYGDIGESWWGESVNAKEVVVFLDAFPSNEPKLEMRINSFGGLTFEGISMRSLLSSFKAKRKALNSEFTIDCYIDGACMSAATLPLLIGDRRIIGLGAQVMIHRSWTFAGGNARDLKAVADDLERMDENISELYAGYTGKKANEMFELMDQETFFTADEAKAIGLATEVEKADEEQSKAVKTLAMKKAGYESKLAPSRSQKYAKTIAMAMAARRMEKGKTDDVDIRQPFERAFLKGETNIDQFCEEMVRFRANKGQS